MKRIIITMLAVAFFAINANATSKNSENCENTKVLVCFKGELSFIDYDSLINISSFKNFKTNTTNENEVMKYFKLVQLDILNNTALSADRNSNLLKAGYNAHIEKRK